MEFILVFDLNLLLVAVLLELLLGGWLEGGHVLVIDVHGKGAVLVSTCGSKGIEKALGKRTSWVAAIVRLVDGSSLCVGGIHLLDALVVAEEGFIIGLGLGQVLLL